MNWKILLIVGIVLTAGLFGVLVFTSMKLPLLYTMEWRKWTPPLPRPEGQAWNYWSAAINKYEPFIPAVPPSKMILYAFAGGSYVELVSRDPPRFILHTSTATWDDFDKYYRVLVIEKVCYTMGPPSDAFAREHKSEIQLFTIGPPPFDPMTGIIPWSPVHPAGPTSEWAISMGYTMTPPIVYIDTVIDGVPYYFGTDDATLRLQTMGYLHPVSVSFKINDQPLTRDATIYVTNPIRMVASFSEGRDQIQRMWVLLRVSSSQTSFELQKQPSSTYQVEFQLPDGTYDLEIKWNDNSGSTRSALSLAAIMGLGQTPLTLSPTMLVLIGLAVIGCIAVAIIWKRRED